MNNDLKHHGVKGMKWGVRRYQNKDGSLKPAGKKRSKSSMMKKYEKSLDKANAKSAAGTAKRKAAIKAAPKKALDGYKNAMEKADAKSAAGTAKRKAAIKGAPKKALDGYKNAMEKADAKSAERTANRKSAVKNAINTAKENRAAAKEKNNPKGVSLKQLKKERVRMVNEETKKTRKKYQKEIQQDVDKAIKFGEKHGLDLDDGGGGDLAKGAEYTRMWREIEKKQERVSREANRQASNRMIEEFGQDSLSRIEKSYERKAKAAMVGLLSVPVATLGLIAYDELR